MLPRKLAFIPFLLIGSILFPKSGDVDLETPFPRITKYALDLILPTNFPHTKFEGKASINFTWPKRDAAPFIALHIKNIDVTTVKLDECTNTAKDLQFQVHNDILFLPKLEELKGKENFVICIEYSGKINTIPDGLYLSSYMENNATVWYFASHLNPKSPHLLFPCSDDPRDKSIVEIKITHPTDYSVISNTSPEKSERNGKTSITRFQPTSQPIPAYMVGLVASKFDQYEIKNDLNITHKIWYRPELKNMHQCAENFSGPIMKAYGNILEHVGYLFNNTLIKKLSGLLAKRPLKLDQVAVPYLPDSAVVVQWGLLTYREDALLCDEQHTGEIDKQKIAGTIAYSLQRMSTGLLPVGWRDAWIMEAWATLLANSILDGIEEINQKEDKWEVNYQFIVKKVQPVMVEDASIFSTPLQWKTLGIPPDANAAKQISELAKVKGAAIVRMIIMIMNVPKIIEVIIRNEIQVFQETLVEIIQLIEEYQETRKSKILPNMRALFSKSFGGVKRALPKGVNISMAMENWIRARGFPIVYVVRKDKKVELSANRYVYNRTYHEPLDNIWYIPISYATSKNPDFENTEVKSTNWIVKTNTLTIDEDLSDGSWIVVNLKYSAYIRVNYDKDLWIALEKALIRNHTQIHVLNRVQIVEDVFELARVYELSYSEHAIPILYYLREENEYHPLYAAMRAFTRLRYRIHSSGDMDIFEKFQKRLFVRIWLAVFKSDHVLKKVLVNTYFCRFTDADCKPQSIEAFTEFINKNKTIEPHMKPIRFCAGLQSTQGKVHWNAMHNKLTKTNAPADTIAIIKGLGCVEDAEVLKSYLNELLDKDSPVSPYIDVVFKSVAEHSAIGTDVALNFLLENAHDLVKDPRFSSSIPNMLRVLSIPLQTQEQLNKLEELKERDVMVNFTIPLKRAIFDVKENFYWEANRRGYCLQAMDHALKTKKSAGMMLIINQILLFIFGIIVIGSIS